MTHRKHPEDASAETHLQAPENAILPPQTRMQIAFLEEAQRAGRFKEYRRVAEGYLELARDTKIDARHTANLLQEILDDLEFPMIALSTEDLIHNARPAIQRALSMLRHNIPRGQDGRPHYNEKALAVAKVSSGIAHGDLDMALKSFPPRIGAPEEQTMRLPEPTNRQRRTAAHSKTPGRTKEGDVPQLSDEVRRNLRAFAAGNAAITLHDIDALMATLSAKRDFFASELEECRKITDIVEDMRDSGFTDDEIRELLESNGIRERVHAFQEMVLELEVALRIASARMKFVNQPDNRLLAREITPDQIRQLLTEGVIDVRLIQDRRAGIVDALKRILPKGKGEHSAETELTLRKVLARREAK